MNFDRVAAPYRTMERMVFRHALERCRRALLPALGQPRRALLIGEGDGRFLQEFLACFPRAEVDVVEPSGAMIRVAQRRIGIRPNVRFHPEHVLAASLTGPYDLVVTHFVLDVFTLEEVGILAAIVRRIAPGGSWLISEFQVCSGPAPIRAVSRACIAGMYAFFRVAAGLRVRAIPPYAQVLEQHGMSRALQHLALNGFVSSELWDVGP